MTDLDISSSTLEQSYIQLQSSAKGLSEAIAVEKMKGQAKLFQPNINLGMG